MLNCRQTALWVLIGIHTKKKIASFIEQKPLTTNAIGIAPVSEFTSNGTKMPGSTL
jgi:hypothetical protein